MEFASSGTIRGFDFGEDSHGWSMVPDGSSSDTPDSPLTQTHGLKCVTELNHVYNIWNESTVDLIIQGQTFSALNHPMHIHGQRMWLIGHGAIFNRTTVAGDYYPLNSAVSFSQPADAEAEKLAEMERRCGHALTSHGTCEFDPVLDQSRLNFVNPSIHDTITIVPHTWTYIRFHAANPGPWFFHCHIAHHLEEGMSVIFNVSPYNQPSIPSHFEQCGLCRTDSSQCVNCTPQTVTVNNCTSSSTTTSTCSGSGVANTVNINFANMFNGFNV
jgi:FtsP/CotA-like multicopper oxidase with cupredoxin domain